MSEFRRFISYIYSYHKAEKLQNTGFAKIEARGEVCRVEIHIKGAYPGKMLPCNAYGFYRKNGLIKGVLLGTFVVKNGIGDMRIVTDRNKMGNTIKSLEDLGGLYITINNEEDNAMASEWDNIPVDTGLFRIHSIEDEAAEKVEEKVIEESVFPREENMGEDTQWESPETARETGTMGEGGAAKEERTAEAGRTAEEEGISEDTKVAAGVEERKVQAEAVIQQEEIKPDKPEEPAANFIEQETAVKDNKNATVQSETILNEQSILCGEMNINVDNFSKNDSKCGEKTEWKTLLTEYPIVNPFAYMNNIEVIKIQPKDLNRLEKKYWVLGNNSFLLHGYCSYRYLILGRNIRDDTFFIGIPGIFHPREKMMASMFGFNEFRMSRNGRLRQGEFGYYIRQVELE